MNGFVKKTIVYICLTLPICTASGVLAQIWPAHAWMIGWVGGVVSLASTQLWSIFHEKVDA